MEKISKQRHLGMPTKRKIFKFWNRKLDIQESCCFACGSRVALHRCHILPSCIEDNNKVSNLHLLCAACHSDSEGRRPYWQWFEYKRKHEYKHWSHWSFASMIKFGLNLDRHVKIINRKFGHLGPALVNCALIKTGQEYIDYVTFKRKSSSYLEWERSIK